MVGFAFHIKKIAEDGLHCRICRSRQDMEQENNRTFQNLLKFRWDYEPRQLLSSVSLALDRVRTSRIQTCWEKAWSKTVAGSTTWEKREQNRFHTGFTLVHVSYMYWSYMCVHISCHGPVLPRHQGLEQGRQHHGISAGAKWPGRRKVWRQLVWPWRCD